MGIKLNKDEVYNWLCSLLLFFIPLSTAIPNLILLLMLPLFVWKVKETGVRPFNEITYMFPPILLFFFFLNSILRGEFHNEIDILLRMGIIVILFFVFSLATNIQRLLYFFVLGVQCSILVSGINTLDFFIHTGELPFGNTGYVNEILLLERPYMGFVCVLSTIISWYIFFESKKKKIKIVFLVSSFLSVFFILFISARMSLLTLLIVGGIGALCLRRMKRRKLWVPLVLITAFTIFLLSGDSIKERFYLNGSVTEIVSTMKNYEPRFTIWPCSFDVMERGSGYSKAFGLGGFGMAVTYLVDCYNTSIENPSKREYYNTKKFNSHNQFIDILLSHGWVGLFLFILLIIIIILKGVKEDRNRFWFWSVIIAFLCFLTVENMLHRQLGCYAFGMLAIFMNGAFNVYSGKDLPTV
ncbi:O-antigen ligase family protein [Sinomicrobium soli]|uniref:O-antigen ligase family protein n=1 Tax=Sinomicrobium sp. N-1-3-6 TaxID=2219864 RepID=UPI000DCCCB13|nr:O-antigen ligase family protein [Sinomicrobium sp. N-1-3-6]RAV29595.1 hypothetical protein DN748_07845 [Sinomicrobium sp. N-1-3-6]